MKNQEKLIITPAIIFAFCFALPFTANAMHIMEGFLPVGHVIAWSLIALPFLIAGYLSIKKTISNDRKSITLLAMSGAFVFVLSSLKIPSVTGSCSHMTGTGLAAILFGPSAVSILGIIVLIFQALLLAHGGFTTLGANTFSMAIAGPFVSFIVYKICKKSKVNDNVSIFLAAFLGDLLTYVVTAFQLAFAYPMQEGGVMASAGKFLLVFAPTQLTLAIIEGLLTVVIMVGLKTYAESELREIGFLKGGSN